MDLLSGLSFALGAMGVIIALYQGFQRKKLSQHLQSQAWYIYSLSNISSGSIQAALKTYKEVHKDNINNSVFENLSKSDAHNVSLFLESIRQIHLSEPKFNLETILTWIQQGKITKEHAPFFIRMMSMHSPNLLSLVWQSLTLRIKKKLIKSISPHDNKKNTQQDSNPVQEIGKS